jgi:hypothetical protein
MRPLNAVIILLLTVSLPNVGVFLPIYGRKIIDLKMSASKLLILINHIIIFLN